MPLFKKPSGSSTGEIIKNLMDDPKLYAEMSAKEGEVWGKVFSDEERNAALKEDQEAAQKLRLNRNRLSLPGALKKHGLHPVDGLSLACGGGRAERNFLKMGICKRFHGIDIAASALREAEDEARKLALDITYELGDLNQLKLMEDAYDLCVTQNCLHHVLRLEDLAEQIHKALRPGGVLWVNDYIGETQFQYTDARLEIVNRILRMLPDELKENKVNKQTIKDLVRREPGTLISPFEAIRSADIMPVFLNLFDVVEKQESDSILGFVCSVGTRGNFAKDARNQAMFELLFYLDELLIEHGILPPRAGCYLLTPKKSRR